MSINMRIENQDYVCFADKKDAEELLHIIQDDSRCLLLLQNSYKSLFADSPEYLSKGYYYCRFFSSIDIKNNYPYLASDGYYHSCIAVPKAVIDKSMLNDAIKADGALNPSRSNNMDNNFMQQVMQAKILKAVLNDKEMDLGKLMLMQSFSSTGKIEISDVIKTKLLGKLLKDGNTDDLPLDKLMLVQALQSGNQIDIGQLLGIKMLEDVLKEDDKE